MSREPTSGVPPERAAKRVLILSGPTREHLDPVRYLTNASSGRQGIALAEEAARRGHRVELIQGPVHLPPPAGVEVVPVTTAREMLAAAKERHPGCDVFISAAAVCDYRPLRTLEGKRKRHLGNWVLELVPNPDILRELAARKGGRVHVGFALETEELLENSRRKLEEKSLDWIVANSPAAIDAEAGDYVILAADGRRVDLAQASKGALARALLDLIDDPARKPPPGGA